MIALPDPTIFRPYRTEEISQRRVALVVGKGRRLFLQGFFYLFPVAIGVMVYTVVYKNTDFPPLFRSLYMGLVILLALLFFTRKVVTGAVIDALGVSVTYFRLFGQRKQTLLWTEASAIELSLRGGRGGGAFYKLVHSNGSRIEFLTIPILYMKEENIRLINQYLQQLSGKEVQRT